MMIKRLICFFRGHVQGRMVMIDPTDEEIARAHAAGAVQIMTRPEVYCARCGREYNRNNA